MFMNAVLGRSVGAMFYDLLFAICCSWVRAFLSSASMTESPRARSSAVWPSASTRSHVVTRPLLIRSLRMSRLPAATAQCTCQSQRSSGLVNRRMGRVSREPTRLDCVPQSAHGESSCLDLPRRRAEAVRCAHAEYGGRCTCGWPLGGGGSPLHSLHGRTRGQRACHRAGPRRCAGLEAVPRRKPSVQS